MGGNILCSPSAEYQSLQKRIAGQPVPAVNPGMGAFTRRVQPEMCIRDRVWDSQAAGDGILRRRLLNAVDDPKTPVFRGQLLLDKSREQAYQLELACPGERILPLETRARVADPVLGDFEALKVSGISYRLDSAGEQTLVILRKDWEAESDVAG